MQKDICTRLGTRVLWLQDPLGRYIHGQGYGESFRTCHIARDAGVVSGMVGGNVLDDQTGGILIQAAEYLIAVVEKKSIYSSVRFIFTMVPYIT